MSTLSENFEPYGSDTMRLFCAIWHIESKKKNIESARKTVSGTLNYRLSSVKDGSERKKTSLEQWLAVENKWCGSWFRMGNEKSF